MPRIEGTDGGSRSTRGVLELPTMWRMRLAAVVVAIFAGLVGGCAAWPETATGGLAELYPSSSVRITDLERRYAAQAHGPAADLAPALLVEARGYLIRAKREQAGGLPADAEASADKVESILRGLEMNWPSPARSTRRL